MSANEDMDDSAAPLIEHLAELRTRLIRSVLALLVAIIVLFVPINGDFVAEHLMNFLLTPVVETLRDMGDENPALQYTSPQEYLFTVFRVSLVGGFALAFPVIAFQLWRFVAPGLYRNEKNAFLPFIIASPLMFFLGASFAQFVVTPLAMTFLLGFADASSFMTNVISAASGGAIEPAKGSAAIITFNGKVNESLDITLKFIMAFGLCFQLPVLLTLMGKAGLVSSEGLGNVRKYAVVAILVLAALVTPPDVITQLILFVVVYGLYEISIQLVKWVEKKREAQLRAEGYYDDEDDLQAEFDDGEGEDIQK
ncbi:twin-arginine translocase subunit TatC [uncultured Sulfitobacter sp.]|uniref:twin-arginine translocase subunit TatC n=1 Tax=uncultured Sulfitobacter sp. TaxID=191468 RepID=UPI00263759B7|nr:twin-arginine translocase subunit TatC [uncultured Sulfitobacter sp.]